jgi:UDP-sugar transporter A1/2/3
MATLRRAETFSKTRRDTAWWLSCSSMALLIVQGTLMSVVLRYSRVSTVDNGTATATYLPSVSVGIAECLKLFICVMYMTLCPSSCELRGGEHGESALPVVASRRSTRAPNVFKDSVPMAVPAGMFVMQQILLIWSATYLDAVTYQIFTQAFKLVPTAVFSRLLLGQKLRPMQWLSIPTLAMGVMCITANTNTSSPGANAAVLSDPPSSMYYLAMAACSIAGLSSSFAGVYFELYVKGKLAGSLITRNFQLGLYGVPFACLYAGFKDGRIIKERGILAGFSAAAWGVVLLQVFGGFIIAMVVKFCDNILKNFALAGSVILTVLVSIPLFGQWPSSFFLLGVGIVLLSVFMYSGGMGAFFGSRSKLFVVWGLGIGWLGVEWWLQTREQRADGAVAIVLPEVHMQE